MIIDILGGSYEHRFKNWNAQRTINWYPKITDSKAQEKNKTQMALFPRPGLSQFVDLGGECVRGIFTALTLTMERCFAVVGTKLYEINYDMSSTFWGNLTGLATGSQCKVYMSCNGVSELFILDPLGAYVFNLLTNTLTKVDPNATGYPNSTTLDYADGYFVTSGTDGRVHFSDLNVGQSWPGFNFFTPTFKPDKVKAIVTFREEIYCFGDETIEVYINDGDTPFIRQQRTSMYFGLTARDSIALHQSGVFFLGKSKTGGSVVYQMGTDYSLTPISTPAITDHLNKFVNTDAEGYVVTTTDGHIFYHLHLPAMKTTLVYDMVTGMWHERQSIRVSPDADGTQVQDMYRGRCFATFKGIDLYGDWWSGKIFKEDNTVSTDDGNIRLLKRTSSVFTQELKYISVYQLEFDINQGFGAAIGQGNDPIMIYKQSIDGGNTFEPEEFINMGTLGDYSLPIRINNLGTARNWVISIEISDPVDIIVMQAVAHGATGSW
jgi:hypothetical protein